MLEDVVLSSGRRARDEPGIGQSDERVVECVVVEADLGVHGHELQHLSRELAADDGGYLSKCLRLTEPIQSGEQRALQGRRYVQRGRIERRRVVACLAYHL